MYFIHVVISMYVTDTANAINVWEVTMLLKLLSKHKNKRVKNNS